MRYRVRISEIRYGEAVVESENEETAQNAAYLNGINWFDHEITDVTVEPEPDRAYTVNEVCPHCESEIEMTWNIDTQGYKAFCPVCGGRLMLCSECMHTQAGDCDYDGASDSCKYNQYGKIVNMDALSSRDAQLKKLWKDFGDLPMNPETERMEEAFLHFPAGTHREEIWHWFDERYSTGVYSLLYASSEDKVGMLNATELRKAYEKQQHLYDIQDIESELENLSEDVVKKRRLDADPVTEEELDEMANALRRRLDSNADLPWSLCKEEAVNEVLGRRPICK